MSDPNSAASSSVARHDPYAALRQGNFRLYLLGNFIAVLGIQMQAAALNWEIYDRTDDPLMLGLVGLAQVVPVLSLILFAGHVADRVDRRRIMFGALSLMACSSLLLATTSYFQWPVLLMYIPLVMIGVARAFHQPAKTSFVPQIVPRATFANAMTWNLGAFQLAQVSGPWIGGEVLWYAGHAYVVYLFEALAAVGFILMLTGVRRVPNSPQSVPLAELNSGVPADSAAEQEATTVANSATAQSLGEGIRFVWNDKVVLGAMALDMFAVLLGGATALMPVYAKDILLVDKAMYGRLLAMPALGSVLMSLLLVHLPPMRNAGRNLLLAVAGFGFAIIVFGLSRNLWLSMFALVISGVCDSVSVVVRHTLIQMQTPDHLRGRVSAISGMFISASNELGEFESGVLARFTSAVFSVVSGGIGTVVVVIGTALAIPKLRHYGSLDGSSQKHRAAPLPTVAPDQPDAVNA